MSAQLKIAALACSYNRLEKTTVFMDSLFAQALPDAFSLDVYLLDDGSTDGTADHIRKYFPAVKVIGGSGSLFWAGAMRLLWQSAMDSADYDLFLLLNDDVLLFNGAIERLLRAFNKLQNDKSIMVGSVQNSDLSAVTYGGRKLLNKITGYSSKIHPDAINPIECDLGNANIMLVSKAAVQEIGILSSAYVHSLADYDYTLRAGRAGIKVLVAPGFYGSCDNDHGKPWKSAAYSLKERVNYLYSPKGLEYKQYSHYLKKFFPLQFPLVFIKLWLKTLIPAIYERYKKTDF